MKIQIILFSAICCMCLAGCQTAASGEKVVKITYTSESGTILPELQWYEEITITKDTILLTRNGKTPDTQVNAGDWQFPADAQQVTALFEQLELIPCSRVVRIEPEEIPDGGGRESYTITYGKGKTCSLYLDPGVSYTNDEWIIIPTQAFIKNMAYPEDAASRYLP